MSDRAKMRGRSVRTRIFAGFACFVALTLILLALFQIVLLPYLYGAITVGQMKEGAKRLAAAGSEEEMYALGAELAENAHMEAALVDGSSGSRVKLSTAVPECLLFDLDYSDCARIAEIAAEKGDGLLLSVTKAENEDDPDPGAPAADGKRPGMRESYRFSEYRAFSGESGANVVYVKALDLSGGRGLILVNAYLAPLGAAARTLSVILPLLGAILILSALLLAGYISGRIAKPIVKINARAKEFAVGNYDVRFDEGHGYREVRELSSTLNQAAVELGKVEKLQKELIANVSHDLRTPLTLIQGYSEMMRDIPGQITPENLSLIVDEVSRLNLLVSDLLETSRIQSGNAPLRPESFCLTDEIRQIVENYRGLTAAKGYVFRFEADSPAWVKADRSLILRAVMNLVNNAMTYTGPDHTVVIRQSLRENFVRIEVIDSGEGVPPDQLERIWDRYYKAEGSHKRAVVGTGLGLSIVKSIVTLHGGNYGVRSRVGQGSAFWIEIPCIPAPEPTGTEAE